jgi:hypothetical protein
MDMLFPGKLFKLWMKTVSMCKWLLKSVDSNKVYWITKLN